MLTTYYANRRGGHCPGHIRDAFLAALETYRDWDGDGTEPRIANVADCAAAMEPISAAARAVWNCNDILPKHAWDVLEDVGLDQVARRRTYASAARALVSALSGRSSLPAVICRAE